MKKHEQLYKSWRELALLKTKMGDTVLQVCEHPDATPEDLMNAATKYAAVVKMLRDHKPVMLDALKNHTVLHASVASMKI
jgi:hypothetical protein